MNDTRTPLTREMQMRITIETARQEWEVENAQNLLPMWFTKRMMNDVWFFGLLLTTGQTLGISAISRVRQDVAGGVWFDVDMLEEGQVLQKNVMVAPCSRTRATVQARYVVLAFELTDT